MANDYRDYDKSCQRLCDIVLYHDCDMKTIGERVRRIRDERGLTQQQLADRAGLAQSTINGIEKGGRQKQPSSLIEIAHALGVDAYWLKTGLGSKGGYGTPLSDEQSIVLEGFALMGEEMRQSWLETAERTIAKAAAAKKAIDAMDAAKRKARVISIAEWREHMIHAKDELFC